MPTNTECKDFIKQIAPIIQQEAKIRGYKVCSPIIAQACIESAYGKSKLAAKYHNYFGMKCGKSWKGKSVNLSTREEYSPGTLTTIKDNFRVYDNMNDGVKGYFDFISSTRYSNLKTAITPKQYLEMIKADGYATSSTYVNTNMNCITKWNLDKYDIISTDIQKTIWKCGDKGDDVKYIQERLVKHGANIRIDGDFGLKTESAVKDFQKKKKLKVDGIVGPNTIKELSK